MHTLYILYNIYAQKGLLLQIRRFLDNAQKEISKKMSDAKDLQCKVDSFKEEGEEVRIELIYTTVEPLNYRHIRSCAVVLC